MFNFNKAPSSNKTKVESGINSELVSENIKTEQILKEIDITKLAEKLKDPNFREIFKEEINKIIGFLKPLEKYVPAIAAGLVTLASVVYGLMNQGDPNSEGFTPDKIAGIITGISGLFAIGSAKYIHDVNKENLAI